MREAAIDSKQAGERGISAKSIKKVTPVSLSHPFFFPISFPTSFPASWVLIDLA